MSALNANEIMEGSKLPPFPYFGNQDLPYYHIIPSLEKHEQTPCVAKGGRSASPLSRPTLTAGRRAIDDCIWSLNTVFEAFEE